MKGDRYLVLQLRGDSPFSEDDYTDVLSHLKFFVNVKKKVIDLDALIDPSCPLLIQCEPLLPTVRELRNYDGVLVIPPDNGWLASIVAHCLVRLNNILIRDQSDDSLRPQIYALLSNHCSGYSEIENLDSFSYGWGTYDYIAECARLSKSLRQVGVIIKTDKDAWLASHLERIADSLYAPLTFRKIKQVLWLLELAYRQGNKGYSMLDRAREMAMAGHSSNEQKRALNLKGCSFIEFLQHNTSRVVFESLMEIAEMVGFNE